MWNKSKDTSAKHLGDNSDYIITPIMNDDTNLSILHQYIEKILADAKEKFPNNPTKQIRWCVAMGLLQNSRNTAHYLRTVKNIRGKSIFPGISDPDVEPELIPLGAEDCAKYLYFSHQVLNDTVLEYESILEKITSGPQLNKMIKSR